MPTSLTLGQIVGLVGAATCFAALLYVVSKAASLARAAAGLFVYLILALSFSSSLIADTPGAAENWTLISAALSCLLPAFCFLLFVQTATESMPEPGDLMIVLIPAVVFPGILSLEWITPACDAGNWPCSNTVQQAQAAVIISGILISIGYGLRRDLFQLLREQGGSRELTALVIALFAITAAQVIASLMFLAGRLDGPGLIFLQNMTGLAFAYLATTLMFRVYPQAVPLKGDHLLTPDRPSLDPGDELLAKRIEELMTLDKLYQDAGFSRADLARELNVSENVASRVINGAFGKGFRRLINEFRVKEAQALLTGSGMAITQVAFDVGFNSLASFNRAFKEIAGVTPSDWRQGVREAETPAGIPQSGNVSNEDGEAA